MGINDEDQADEVCDTCNGSRLVAPDEPCPDCSCGSSYQGGSYEPEPEEIWGIG